MDTIRYYVALVIVVAFLPPVLAWLVIHPLANKWRIIGPWGTYIAISGFIVLGMLSIWSVRSFLLATDFGFRIPLVVLAAVCLCLAICLRVGWRRVIRPSTILGLPEIYGRQGPGELVTSGIYSHIRHPRYLEVGMVLVASAFFSNYLAVYIVGLVYIPLIYIVVHLEERELKNRFGSAYEDYCLRVPKFFPSIRFRDPGRG